jgi:hypothetical protein
LNKPEYSGTPYFVRPEAKNTYGGGSGPQVIHRLWKNKFILRLAFYYLIDTLESVH